MVKEKKNKGGRPRLKIDYKLVRRLASIHCTVSEIAYALDVSESHLNHSEKFLQVYKKEIEGAKQSLRRLQWEKAQGQDAELLRDDKGMPVLDSKNRPILKHEASNPDTTMQIWLGKQYLDQRDKRDEVVDVTSKGESIKPDYQKIPTETYKQAVEILARQGVVTPSVN